MGGVEHISIHHTNEIAQSEAATGKKFVKYWLHNEHLLVDGKKMAKSEGTGYTVDEIVANGYHPLVLRYFFLSAHYRSQQNFTYEALEGAKRGLERLLISVHTLNGEGNVDAAWDRKFCDYLDNDFNIPAAFALVWEVLADNSLSDGVRRATILAWDNVLGLSLDTTSKKVPEAVVQKLKERNEARKERNFEYSDTIRSELLSEGFVIEDSPEGSRVVPAHPLAFFLENA